ncbi:MAG: hypothetical protein U1F76_14795 [Candidatus Competibacteraceae bacterium]
MRDALARLNERTLETKFRLKATAYFGCLLRRLRVVEIQTLEDQLATRLSLEEFGELLLLDILLTGQSRRNSENPEVWLAVEVSAVIDREDVVHGRRQADLLRKAGYPAIPVAAGEEVTPGAREEARIQGVALVLEDESRLLWDEALSASLAATIPDGER